MEEKRKFETFEDVKVGDTIIVIRDPDDPESRVRVNQ